MGFTTNYRECKKCGGITISTRAYSKTITTTNCTCDKIEIFKQMEEKDFEQLNIILNDPKINGVLRKDNYYYWQRRVNGRLTQLQPLINELKEKNIELITLSKELNKEYLELLNVKLFYKF